MAKHRGLVCRPLKDIILPVSNAVDITSVRSLVDSSLFQRLRYCRQLGAGQVVYPGAVHTRFAHSLGTGDLAIRRSRRLKRWRQITAQQEKELIVFGFAHDIGHGPMSHITDSLVTADHEERAVPILRSLSREIEKCGVDPEKIVRMMLRQDPLAQAIVHTPLGADKLDYLARDAYETGIEGMLSFSEFLDHVFYIDNELVADSKILDSVNQLSSFYRLMYAKVYYRTAVVVTERYIQQMLSILLGQSGFDAEISEAELVAMTDSDLDYVLSHAQNPSVREKQARYVQRSQPYPALVYVYNPYHRHQWTGRHKMRFEETPVDSLLENKGLRDSGRLTTIEREIEEAVGLPFDSVLVAPPVPARRFYPPEVRFLTNNGIVTSREMRPEYWDSQMNDARRYARLYVCTFLEQCPELITKSAVGKISEILTRYA